MIRSLSCLAALVFVAGGGCVQAPASEPTGSIAIPLTAPGPGGATYRLPAMTALVLTQGVVSTTFSLDGDAALQTVDVAPGAYQVNLTDAAGDTAIWPLTRLRPDGTSDTVQAALDLVSTITVADHQTTSLVIRFHVPMLGTVAFSSSVDVSLEVVEIPTTAFHFALSAPALSPLFVVVTPDAPDALRSRLPTPSTTGDGYALTAHVVGPWTFRFSDTVCAAIVATRLATGNPGFVELVAEAPPTAADQLCIQQNAPGDAIVTMDFFRQGPALTPLLSDLGDREYFVGHSVGFTLAANLLDHFALDLSPLSGAHALRVGVFGDVSVVTTTPNSTATTTWYAVQENGDATVTVTGP